MFEELNKIYGILAAFLGEAKNGFDGHHMQLQFPCPRCIEKYGKGEIRKNNLEIGLHRQKFNCWKCADEGDGMHGSILKLIKLYGSDTLLKEYKDAIHSLRESKMYKIHFSDADFNIDTKSVELDDLSLPVDFRLLRKDKHVPKDVMSYLTSRGIGWDVIEQHSMGYTEFCKDGFTPSYRIYIPSYNEYGELNYWTGRDYKNREKVVKYFNPKVERKSIIFNEDKVQWDADIVLVEGPFDHIVVPNSIPLLGKALNYEFKLFYELNRKCNANILIFLDGDAYGNVKKIYNQLNHGRLYGKIRYIPVEGDLDPSKIYEIYGKKGIIEYLKRARQIPEIELVT